MPSELLGVLGAILAAAGVVWLVRRGVGRVRCPHCAADVWSVAGDMKQCGRCGRLFV